MLHLSGPKLRVALERLIRGCETLGGIEHFSAALKLKANAFHELLGEGRVARLERSDFEALCDFMATVRRRIAPVLGGYGWRCVRSAIAELLDGAYDTTTVDDRIAQFCSSLEALPTTRLGAQCSAQEATSTSEPSPQEGGVKMGLRFVRDLAAELLHNCYPEQYPLMHRWVWDNRTNTGVLREIWHGDNVDHMLIDVPDGYETFLMLREELSQFLSDNGVFRDMLWYVDLLTAQVYADYINEQGGAYLRTDFATEGDPLEHTRRILGLDGRRRKGNVVSGEFGEVVKSPNREIVFCQLSAHDLSTSLFHDFTPLHFRSGNANRICSSRSCLGVASDGAPMSRSAACWFMGKRATSRTVFTPVSSMTIRSSPAAMPP